MWYYASIIVFLAVSDFHFTLVLSLDLHCSCETCTAIFFKILALGAKPYKLRCNCILISIQIVFCIAYELHLCRKISHYLLTSKLYFPLCKYTSLNGVLLCTSNMCSGDEAHSAVYTYFQGICLVFLSMSCIISYPDSFTKTYSHGHIQKLAMHASVWKKCKNNRHCFHPARPQVMFLFGFLCVQHVSDLQSLM